jgi:hypothetical protein
MGVRICSLICSEPQSIPAGSDYHLLRFPFGGGESYDEWGMHQMTQPDNYQITDWRTDDRSGLIWPSKNGWGTVHGLVYWGAGGYTEVRSRVVRDPLDVAGGYDSTCTEDHVASPGGQFRAKTWGLFVKPSTPLGLMVRHNASSAQTVTFAEFKLIIADVEHPTEEGA